MTASSSSVHIPPLRLHLTALRSAINPGPNVLPTPPYEVLTNPIDTLAALAAAATPNPCSKPVLGMAEGMTTPMVTNPGMPLNGDYLHSGVQDYRSPSAYAFPLSASASATASAAETDLYDPRQPPPCIVDPSEHSVHSIYQAIDYSKFRIPSKRPATLDDLDDAADDSSAASKRKLSAKRAQQNREAQRCVYYFCLGMESWCLLQA